jgi:hypothetical protein
MTHCNLPRINGIYYPLVYIILTLFMICYTFIAIFYYYCIYPGLHTYGHCERIKYLVTDSEMIKKAIKKAIRE